MTHDDLVMQFQADLCVAWTSSARRSSRRPPRVPAYAAGTGGWLLGEHRRRRCQLAGRQALDAHHGAAERDRTYRLWKKAVTRTLDWVDDDVL